MTTQHRYIRQTAALLLTALALGGCGKAPQQTAQDATSKEVTETPIFLDADQEAQAQNVAQSLPDEKTIESRFVRINYQQLKRAIEQASQGKETKKLRLNLLRQQDVVFNIEQINKISDNNIVLVGRIDGDENSAVTLVMKDDVVLANINRGDRDESYQVRYIAKGLHQIRMPEPDHSDDCIEVPSPLDPSISRDEALAQKMAEPTNSVQSLPVIDMLVAYTPAARSRVGGTSAMLALIQMGIADTNRAMTDSGVSAQVRLVGTKEMTQNETGDWSSDLSSLRGKTDGRWDSIHSKRTAVGADQVTLIGAYAYTSGTAGIGYVNASYSTAFTIVKSNTFSNYTFSHELGHNLALNHSDGYVNTAGRFRTIIAYGTYPRIRRYSNPYRNYNGYRTGDSYHYEARIINNHAYSLSTLLSPRI